MGKFIYTTFLIVVIMSMVLCTIRAKKRNLISTTSIPITTTTFSQIEHSESNQTHGLMSEDIQSSFLRMKTIKTISKSINNVFYNVNESTAESLNKMSSVINKLNKTEINLYEESNILYSEYILKINENFKILSDIISNIDYLFNNYYLGYLNGHTSNASLQVFISKVMSLDTDGPGKSAFMLQKFFYSKINGTLESNLLKEISNEVNKTNGFFCSIRQTPQQFMYNLYISLAKSEFKAYIMILSAYKIHAAVSEDDYTKDFERIQAEHFERMKNYLTVFSDTFYKSSTAITPCSAVQNDMKNADEILAINKLPKESDYHNNKVVTGIRFIVKNQVLHVQIEEGELISNGKILPGSEKWIPIDDIDYNSRTVNRSGQVTRIRQCIDYHSVTESDYWYLNDVTAPPNFVVVGANLEAYGPQENSNKLIYLRLKLSKVNITTAQLDLSQEQYIDNLSEVPTQLGETDLREGTRYVYLQGEEVQRNSDYGSQWIRVKPFFYSQAVYGNPRVPLSGIGTFSEKPTDVNMILFKIFTFDISSFVDMNE